MTHHLTYICARIFISIALISVSIGITTGQSITVSEEIPLKNDYAYDIIGKMEDQILLFRDQGSRFEVHAYDDEMRQRWERELGFEKRKIDIISLIPGTDVFHIIYGYRYKGDYYVKHRHYDANADIIDSTTIDVVEKLYFSPRFKQTYSQDKSKLLLFRTDKESEVYARVYALESQETLWTKQLTFKGGVLRRDFRRMLVTNDGDMFMVMDHPKNNQRNKQFNIMRIPAGSRSVATKTVELNDMYAFDLFTTYDNVNKQFVLSGLYNEKMQSRSKGVFLARLGLNDSRARVRLIPFTEDLLQEVHGKDVSLKKGLTDFSVQDIVLRADGGALLIAEMNREYSRRPNVPVRRDGGFGRGGWVDYYFEDMILLSIHPDDTEHWRTVLHKKQYSQDDDGMYSSYFLFKTPEKLRLLFNDEIRQENTVSEYTIRGNGYYKRKSVFSTDYQRLRLRFRDAVQVAYNECIVPSERNSRLNLVRIRFED